MVSEETKDRRKAEFDAIQAKSKKLETLKIEYLPIGNIKPNWYNPNRQSQHEFELLVKSMGEDGFTQPVIVLKDGTIVDGEHRWRAAQALGYKEIPVVVVDMSPEQMRISTLRHNRARGKEDVELVARVIRDLQNLGAVEWAKDSLLLSDDEFNAAVKESEKETGVHGSVADILEKEEQARVDEKNRTQQDYVGSLDGVKVFMTEDEKTGQKVASSMSLQAADLLRKHRDDLVKQHDQEYRDLAEESSKISTFIFVYADNEAKVVRAALGDTPAVKAVELCKREYEKAQVNA